jgi:alginate O-acetyltransferase complex protein AlgI
MLFNTYEFAALLAFALPSCALLRHLFGRRGQNALLLVASYLFYGWWDVRFLALLWLSTAVDFLVGRALSREDKPGVRGGWSQPVS